MVFGKKQQQKPKPMEEEIAELQRKFLTPEIDKRNCSEDNQGTIGKQRATIEKVTREDQKMKAELADTRSSSLKPCRSKKSKRRLVKRSSGRRRRMPRS